MKKLKLFPKTFFYTLTIMIFVIVIAHILIYLLAPKMGMVISTSDNIAEKITVDIREEKIVMQAIQKALPFSFICSLLISVICSLLFSKEIVVNDLYSNFLSTIEHLEQEKDRVSEMERAKVDFLRAASHELKTPVTALNATLENMILGVGKYQDYAAYLPECKDMVERLSKMIHEILETSKLNGITEQWATVDLSELLEELCEPYQLIAAAHNISFSLDLPEIFTVTLPISSFSKAVSNVLANAVAYTEAGKAVTVFMDGRSLMIENECVPIQSSEISRLFEPFYRPDFSRNRESGGNGLGLYIVDALLTSINISYSFIPMKNPLGMCFTFQL